MVPLWGHRHRYENAGVVANSFAAILTPGSERYGKMEPSMLRAELADLSKETYDLIEIHLPDADVERLRAFFCFERTFWTHAPPGHGD
jgi:hypothetical protein